MEKDSKSGEERSLRVERKRGMRKRTAVKADGRYIYYYEFTPRKGKDDV